MKQFFNCKVTHVSGFDDEGNGIEPSTTTCTVEAEFFGEACDRAYAIVDKLNRGNRPITGIDLLDTWSK